MNKAIISLAITLSFALSACASTLVDAPSLNKREFEISLAEMRSQASQAIAGDDSILAASGIDRNSIGLRLGADAKTIWQAHKKADANFATQSSHAQIKVRNAQGLEFGSDNWSIAQVEISRLDRTRAPSLQSLGALDKIIFANIENKASNQNISSENIEILLQLQKFIQSDVATQSRFLDSLSHSLVNR